MEIEYEELTRLVLSRLRDYSNSGGDLGSLARVTGSSTDTVRRWVVGTPPSGTRLIKLWYMLAESGMKSPELETLSEFNRYCGELLVFGLATAEELMDICGLRNQQGVFRILRGGRSVQSRLTLSELTELYGDKLSEVKHKLPAHPTEKPLVAARARATPARQKPAPVPAPAPILKLTPAPTTSVDMGALLTAASQLYAVTVVARYFNSDQVSPETRSKLRELMGEGMMFELSNHLNALCSERSRNQGRP